MAAAPEWDERPVQAGEGCAQRIITSAPTKGVFVASVTVVTRSVWFLTKFSFGLLAKQKQKVVSRTFVSILFILFNSNT